MLTAAAVRNRRQTLPCFRGQRAWQDTQVPPSGPPRLQICVATTVALLNNKVDIRITTEHKAVIAAWRTAAVPLLFALPYDAR
jgi:hypothetical protein